MHEILNIWCNVGIDTIIYIPHLMFKLCIRFNHHCCKNCWWMMTLIRKVKFMIAVYGNITYSIKYFIDKSSTNEVLKWSWLHGCKISRKTRNEHIFWRMSRWLSNSRNLISFLVSKGRLFISRKCKSDIRDYCVMLTVKKRFMT